MMFEARALVPSFAGPVRYHEARRTTAEKAITASALVVCVGAPLWLLSSALALGVATVTVAIALTLVIGLAGGGATRRDERAFALYGANASSEPLEALTRIVDQIARFDRSAVARYELEALLDRHVAVTIAHERAVRAAALASREQLEQTREACARLGRIHHLQLCEARLRSLDRCEAIAAELAEELATIAELIAAIAQLTTCPALPAGDGVVERCTEELAAATSAHAELG